MPSINVRKHSSMMIAMTREGKDQGLCSAALRELWRIAKDQIEERDVVVIVMCRNLAAWRKASMKSVKREDQLKCITAEEMRTITNDECVAGKIKFDESENAVMDESRIGKFEQGDRKHKLKNDAMDGVEDGRSEDCRGDEKETVGKCGIIPVDAKWIDTSETFEGEPLHTNVRKRNSK